MSRHKATCPTCERTFVAIGRHWSTGDCDFPPISDAQQELIAGLLLGDGFIRQPGERERDQEFPGFELELVNGEYVEWVAERLTPFVSNIDHPRSTTADHETTRLYTVGHPDLQRAAFWVEMDRPIQLAYRHDITPAILNAMYATRGSLNWVEGGANVRFTPRREAAHIVERFCREQGWTFSVVREADHYLGRAHTEAFFEYIGDPPPGFDWKWRYDDEVAYRESVNIPSRGEA